MDNWSDGIRINHPLFDSSPYSSLSFWINGGSAGGQQLYLRGVASGNFQPPITLSPLSTDTWTQVTVPLSSLGVANRQDFEGIVFQDATFSPLPVFFLDDIRLVDVPEPSSLLLLILGPVVACRLVRSSRVPL